MRSTLFAEITDALAGLLRDDPRLAENMGSDVAVFVGPPRVEALNRPAAVFVYRANTDDATYALGTEVADVAPTWELALLRQHTGDPELLEQRGSILLCNVWRILLDHKCCTGLWDWATIGGSRAVDIRLPTEQSWEVEVVPVRLQLFDVERRR